MAPFPPSPTWSCAWRRAGARTTTTSTACCRSREAISSACSGSSPTRSALSNRSPTSQRTRTCCRRSICRFTATPPSVRSRCRGATGRRSLPPAAIAWIHVARQGERAIGFVLSLKDGETAFAYHIGFDRTAAAQGIPVYLRLLHASLAQAIAFGCRRVSFGRTALEPKARMGCVPEPAYVWARHRHPMFNQLVQPLLRLGEAEEAPAITPFRPGAAS